MWATAVETSVFICSVKGLCRGSFHAFVFTRCNTLKTIGQHRGDINLDCCFASRDCRNFWPQHLQTGWPVDKLKKTSRYHVGLCEKYPSGYHVLPCIAVTAGQRSHFPTEGSQKFVEMRRYVARHQGFFPFLAFYLCRSIISFFSWTSFQSFHSRERRKYDILDTVPIVWPWRL